MQDRLDEWNRLARTAGAEQAVTALCQWLREQGRWHELFDVRLLAERHRLGAPLAVRGGLDSLAEPLRTQLEDFYLEACREVGSLFLERGSLREAWLYLRPAGERAQVAQALACLQPSAEQLEAAVELAVYQGLAPRVGLEWVLAHYGTCTAISTIDSAWSQWSTADRVAVVELLVAHVHRELLANLQRDIANRDGALPEAGAIGDLIAGRPQLFEENNYHLDTSHLHATVRMAREARSPLALEQAWQLTEYGRRLAPIYQFRGEPPFEDVYASHGRFFAAQLGRQVEEALEYFRVRAGERSVAEQGSGPAETLIVLLDRLGLRRQALEAALAWLPPGTPTTNWAPGWIELAQSAGAERELISLAAERDDAVALAAGWLGEAHKKTQAT